MTSTSNENACLDSQETFDVSCRGETLKSYFMCFISVEPNIHFHKR